MLFNPCSLNSTQRYATSLGRKQPIRLLQLQQHPYRHEVLNYPRRFHRIPLFSLSGLKLLQDIAASATQGLDAGGKIMRYSTLIVRAQSALRCSLIVVFKHEWQHVSYVCYMYHWLMLTLISIHSSIYIYPKIRIKNVGMYQKQEASCSSSIIVNEYYQKPGEDQADGFFTPLFRLHGSSSLPKKFRC